MEISEKKEPFNKGLCIFFSIIAIVSFTTVLSTPFTGGCMSIIDVKDSISNLSFNHDGRKVVFDRCRGGGCQIQVYDLETGELAAYQSPKGERWTMGKYAYDGKKFTFSVIPIKPKGGLDLGQMQIAVMDANGKNYRKVTTGPGAKLYPTFSHNGKKILYACAARIREKGRTPAAQYDAWEVNLETGEQTQLTFFQYYYMSNLTYYPDDERFIYYGENPSVFEGAYADQSAFRDKLGEIGKQGKGIHYIVVMKGKELIPNPYKFPPKTRPESPLLSKDSSMLIYEKHMSAGKFFLYSPDGNHRQICQAGSVDSVAISSDGQSLGLNVSSNIFIINISDGKIYHTICVKRTKNWDEKVKKNPSWRLLPEQPLVIMNK